MLSGYDYDKVTSLMEEKLEDNDYTYTYTCSMTYGTSSKLLEKIDITEYATNV